MNDSHSSDPLEDRVTELEVRLTYQDRLIAELNDVILELRGELQRLAAKTRRVEEQLDAGLPESPANAPPPHY